ncbi:hypothetical protein Acr_05g0014230 [Actinidia rufa]|uniref:Uncharacterized protein n=1 Tax=Actinidia rufa TaxID=165716 RepID=A0A7J0EMR5_9ERIC|nr:hypothetical protein Acr_05g0014230 [Actinidia rufa]
MVAHACCHVTGKWTATIPRYGSPDGHDWNFPKPSIDGDSPLSLYCYQRLATKSSTVSEASSSMAASENARCSELG